MSKRLVEAEKLIDKTQTYPIEEAVKLAKESSKVKFDASVEVHFRLNIDPKKTEQKIRTQTVLPHGTGKTLKVAAFVSAAKEKDAKNAGADIIGGEELIKEIKQKEKTDFDIAVAEPTVMPKLAQIAKILGSRGLMPSPKTGTVGQDILKMVKDLKGGKIDIKTDDSGNIHQILGKVGFDDKQLVENFETIKQAIYQAKPSGIKKDFVANIALTTSMGPSIKVAL